MPSGYDLDTPPIHVAPDPAESPVSWLRRTAARYQISPRDVLREGGAVRQITSTQAPISRITSTHSSLLSKLGVTDDDRRALRALTPLGAALRAYTRLYQRPDHWQQTTTSRYCPTCLADPDPRWAKDWTNPLLAVCPTHGCFLLQHCPSCDAAPYASPTWLADPIELWRCTARTRRERSTGRQIRPWCGHDLRTAPTTAAPPDQARAQRLLLTCADLGDEETEACGITATGRIAFDAIAELATRSRYHRGARFLTTTETPEATAAALADTLPVMTATTPEEAGQHLQRHAQPTSPHAPVTVAAALASPPKNPLLGALQLDRHRHAMTATSQLVFRTTARHAQYPLQDGHSPAARRALQLPEHRPDRPRPTPAWIPQVLWPDAPPGLGEDPLDRAEAALFLAQMGSARTRAFLLVELGLPRTVHVAIIARTKNRRADGTWPQLLTDLEALLERLRAHPPWVDYRNRRLIADDLDLLDRALTAADTGPTSLETLRRFWELFTGGDALFAPDPVAVSIERHPEWAGHRAHADAAYAHRFDAAFELLDRSSPLRLGRPLVWRPPWSEIGFDYEVAAPDGPTLHIDPEDFLPTRAALTLTDRLPLGGDPLDAARTTLTRRSGQPGALALDTADRWAGPTAALHTCLQAGLPPADDALFLPFMNRYRQCLPPGSRVDIG